MATAVATVQTIPETPTFEQTLLQIGIPADHAAAFRGVTLPFELWPHQSTSLQALLAWDRCGLFLEPRCGKTIVMQLASIWFAKYGLKSIFVMPPSLFDQFLETFSEIGNHGMVLETLSMSAVARKKFMAKLPSSGIHALLMSKEIFKKELHNLMHAGYKILFFDECHMGLQSEMLQTGKGAYSTYGACQFFIDNSVNGRIVLSTGTPIYNGMNGTYPMINLKTPEAYLSKREFDYLHTEYTKVSVINPKTGSASMIQVVDNMNHRNPELLHENLYHQSVRALRREVLDMAVPNIQEIPLHLHAPHMKLYRQVVKERLIEFEGKLIDARQQSKLRALALQLITSPGIVSEKPVKNAVMEAVQVLLDSIDIRHNKALLFANFNCSVEAVAQAFTRYNPAVIYGPNGPDNNRKSIQKFKTDDKYRIAVANPVSGGVGLTFGQVSQTVIVVEPMSVHGQFDQAISRVLLEGQDQPIVVYILKVMDTISPRAVEQMKTKALAAKEVMKDSKTLLDELLGRA